ncbi:MAG: hypothetical protein HOE99_00865, partial [Acidiferrobacteraceae bacterium]|nr:hypothetical protein [Acidiferrobacteraceae bacterium]
MEQPVLSLRTLLIGNALALALVLGLQALFPTTLLDFELRIIDSRFRVR